MKLILKKGILFIMYMLPTGEYTETIYSDFKNASDFFHVDSLAAPVVSLLNYYGYETEYSCEGHIAPYELILVNDEDSDEDYNEDNLRNEIDETTTISAPYIAFKQGVIINLKNPIPEEIGELIYYRNNFVKEIGAWLIDTCCEPLKEEELKDADGKFCACIYLNNDEEDVHNPYKFYRKSLDQWEALYMFFIKNLINNRDCEVEED